LVVCKNWRYFKIVINLVVDAKLSFASRGAEELMRRSQQVLVHFQIFIHLTTNYAKMSFKR